MIGASSFTAVSMAITLGLRCVVRGRARDHLDQGRFQRGTVLLARGRARRRNCRSHARKRGRRSLHARLASVENELRRVVLPAARVCNRRVVAGTAAQALRDGRGLRRCDRSRARRGPRALVARPVARHRRAIRHALRRGRRRSVARRLGTGRACDRARLCHRQLYLRRAARLAVDRQHVGALAARAVRGLQRDGHRAR